MKNNNEIQVIKTRAERYLEVVNTPEIFEGFNDIEKMVINSAINPTIENLESTNPLELIRKIGTVSEFICKDLGIKTRYDTEEMTYSATRFLMILKTHFKDLTIQDIKLAFELLEVGQLDEFLPYNKNGIPDREHYQTFNVRFYSKVLNAFKNYKSNIFGKGHRKIISLQQAGESIITPKQRKENSQETIEDIYTAFNAYKFKGIIPRFILSIFINKLIERGLIDLPKVTKSDIKKAKDSIIKNKSVIQAEKSSLIKDYHNGLIGSKIENIAQIDVNNRAISEWFDSLIKNKTNIKSILK